MPEQHQPLSPEQQDWLARLSETMLWLGYEGRRPGLLEEARAILGRSEGGKSAQLEKTETGWTLHIDGSVVKRYSGISDALEVIPDHGFLPERVVVVADIAGLLFKGAVEQAEASVNDYREALAITVRANLDVAKKVMPSDLFGNILSIPIRKPVDFTASNSLLDRSLRHSLAGIVLAIAALEAQVNSWGQEGGGWTEEEDRTKLVRKCRLLVRRVGEDLDTGAEPFQGLQQLITFRNDVVHARAMEHELPMSQRAAGRDMSLRARETCLAVRRTTVLIADVLHKPRPDYLVYCPDSSPDDDEVWARAIVSAGIPN